MWTNDVNQENLLFYPITLLIIIKIFYFVYSVYYIPTLNVHYFYVFFITSDNVSCFYSKYPYTIYTARFDNVYLMRKNQSLSDPSI